jgi:hypothetical protein
MIGDVQHKGEARHFAVDTGGVLADRQWFEQDIEALIYRFSDARIESVHWCHSALHSP